MTANPCAPVAPMTRMSFFGEGMRNEREEQSGRMSAEVKLIPSQRFMPPRAIFLPIHATEQRS